MDRIHKSKIAGIIKQIRVSKQWFLVFTIFTYLFFTVFYMGPSVWKCNDTLYGFGDNTAGPVWRFGLKPPQSPVGSFENMTNFPVGENLYTPAVYSLSGQSSVIWANSRIFGPVCGYNLFNMGGFFLSALVMFGFIYALTKRRWIAWFAGFAVSFSPYYQMKVGGHPGYGYQALLIGSVWALYSLIKYKRKRDIALFAGVTASCFYFDPYFSLLVVCMVAPILLVWLVGFYLSQNNKKREDLFDTSKKTLVALFKAGILTALLLLPLVFVTIKNSSQIASSVAASRGNVLFEAKACSNLPHEYITPFVLHPIFERLAGKAEYIKLVDNLHNGFSCGIGEDTVGVSIAIMTVTIFGLTVILWEVLNKRKLGIQLGYNTRLVFYGIGAVLVTGFLIGFPPMKLLGLIPTPSFVMLEITTTWRTLTRLYVVVNFAVITLFSIVLLYFSNHFRKYRKTLLIIFILLFGAVLIEYQAFKPFTGNKLSTFSYKNDVPSSYTWLKAQKDINTIAEYPLEKSGGESNAMAYYLSMQVSHGKKLFNSNIATSYEDKLRDSMKDLSDPQSVQVLGGLGIDAVVIHGVDESEIRKIPGLEVVHISGQETFNILAFTPTVTNDKMVIARIKNTDTKQMMYFSKGFPRNTNLIKSSIDWDYEALNKSEIDIVPIPGGNTNNNDVTMQCFNIRMAGPLDSAVVTVLADGIPAFSGTINHSGRTVTIPVKSKIILSNNKGFNMQLSNLGCL